MGSGVNDFTSLPIFFILGGEEMTVEQRKKYMLNREERRKEGQKYNERRKAAGFSNQNIADFLQLALVTIKRFHNGQYGIAQEYKDQYRLLLDNPELFKEEVWTKITPSESRTDNLYKNLSKQQMEALIDHPKLGPAIPQKWLDFHHLSRDPKINNPKSGNDIKGIKERAAGVVKGQFQDDYA